MQKIFFFFSTIFLINSAFAEPYSLSNPVPDSKMRPMTTERPSKNSSSYIIDVGHLQIESTLYSFTANKNAQQKLKQKSVFNSTTFRLGITKNSEISLVVTPFIWQKTKNLQTAQSNNIRTNDDVLVRYKKNIFGGDPTKNRGSLALMPYLKIPASKKNYSNDYYEGGLKTHYDYKMEEYLLSYLFDVSIVRKMDNSSYAALVGNIIDFGKNLTPKIYSYIEIASFSILHSKTSAKNYLDFGTIYQVNKNLSIDIVTNFGVSKAAEDFNFITGFSYRF